LLLYGDVPEKYKSSLMRKCNLALTETGAKLKYPFGLADKNEFTNF
jgi:hypothetical protein